MRVEPHLSQHETVEELPLLTESAVVTEVSSMDRNRTEAVLDALRAILDAHDADAWRRDRPDDDAACERWLRDLLDEADHLADERPLDRYVAPDRRSGRLGERIADLQARYLQPYPSLLRVRVEADEPVAFAAGQYLALRYRGTTRVYSVASSPARDDVEFCVRRVPGGELTTDLAVALDPGDEVTLRGPYGDLLLEEPSARDAVFLATGTGVAPFKSMLDYGFETGWDRHDDAARDVWLFLGAGWRDELPYREAFESLAAERENFHFVPTLSRESYLTDWEGETDYVQYVLAKYLDDDALGERSLPPAFADAREAAPRRSVGARLDPASMEVYACGIDAMVQSLVAAVRRLGVPEEHTRFEGFG